MNVVYLVGSLVGVEAAGDEEALLILEARGEAPGIPRRLFVRASGVCARACLSHLSPGARVAVEGEITGQAAGGGVDVEARRVQFLHLGGGAERALPGPERPAAA